MEGQFFSVVVVGDSYSRTHVHRYGTVGFDVLADPDKLADWAYRTAQEKRALVIVLFEDTYTSSIAARVDGRIGGHNGK